MTSLYAKIEELQEYVCLAQYDKIDLWFSDNPHNCLTNRDGQEISEQDFLKQTSLYIGQYVCFFNFKKNSNDAYTIHHEAIAREKAILKHFEFKEQIDLIASIGVLGTFKEEYLSILKPSAEYDAMSANRLITRLFHQENFSLLEKLETYFKPGILEQKFYQGEIQLKEKQSGSIFELAFKEPLFSPYYDILFNYSQKKEDYLTSRNISLPNNEETYALIHSTLHENVTNSDDFFVNLYQTRLLDAIEPYCTVKRERENNHLNLEQKNKAFKM